MIPFLFYDYKKKSFRVSKDSPYRMIRISTILPNGKEKILQVPEMNEEIRRVRP